MYISGVVIKSEHILIATVLLNKLEDKGNEIITYSELSSSIGGLLNPRNLDHPLGDLSAICRENGLPLISAIVVNKDTMMPGDGFIKYFYNHLKSKNEKDAQTIKCINEVISFDNWDKLKEILNIN